DLALGVYWRKEKFYAGVSFNHLLKSTFDFGLSQRNSLQTHMFDRWLFLRSQLRSQVPANDHCSDGLHKDYSQLGSNRLF
ncbi:MAG: type IX secretion system membrane protein PorP/SprF, partial [Cyclobacteriaceae bacterium]|nr:type IX secretion system membrane protein PorP/SprF [Cyclobacteriaceae bacterium]